MKLLYYAPESHGGLLNYAQDHANAFANRGVEVTLLCAPSFVKRSDDLYSILPVLVDSRKKAGSPKWVRLFFFMWRCLRNMLILRREILRGGYTYVLFSTYAEYLAPLWAWMFRSLDKQGIVFAAVVQEPVRDMRVGPVWWHRWSVRSAYGFLSCAFTHDQIVLDTCGSDRRMSTSVIPYGPHRFPDATKTREQTRLELKMPNDAVVLFSFGFIRDGKNLDYSIKALREVPDAYLIVAGKRASGSQRPESYYVELAESLGVANRCRWKFDYLTEEDAADLFTACDLVILTYSALFRSASSVLHVAARYRKQVIASAGQGSLQSVVKNHGLGVWVEPDDPEAVVAGLKEWIASPPITDWEGYIRNNSWDRSAEIILKAFNDLESNKRN